MPDATLVAEKTDQAAEILRESDENVDLWLTFARETGDAPEPVLPLVLGYDVVWPSIIAITPDGRTEAILGRYDAPEAESMGVHEVRTYDESIEEPALDLLADIDPERIAVNYSVDDVTADGLSHGMYLRLQELLAGTPYADRLVSAEDVVARLRGVKSPTEAERVRVAAATTTELLDGMAAAWGPDWTEADVAEWLSSRVEERGLGYAWSPAACPTVHAGADAEVGHTTPGDRTLPPGEALHVDFGVKVDGYAADVQRMFYRRGDDADGSGDAADATPPDDLQRAFADVRAALEAGRERLAPGVAGHEVDAAARESLTGAGHPEFKHAFGHTVGRNAHDGGTLLGPRWDRYGAAPERRVRAGEFYAIECGVPTDYGYVGLEEMVFVGESGQGDGNGDVEYVTGPQRELRVLDG